ncbi:hypothetical protein VTJ83DRAFT_4940 [Remersonia thermophila]|uniref:2,5-diamino-6-ribosylamino-4(3H)-pyrimidinone 5'-phosphate reductase n=1 Tax=Remersonia thermophila TaxID=72144 RepID=A0ABR4DBG5_9PEZI
MTVPPPSPSPAGPASSGPGAASKQDDTLPFPPARRALIAPYLPPSEPAPPAHARPSPRYPYLTLTYASSLDASIALVPGRPIALSSRDTYAMTHFLRSRHDALLVGAGTAAADDPRLNSRLRPGGEGEEEEEQEGTVKQPRPVVLDARGRWRVGPESRVVQAARQGKGLGPWVLVSEPAFAEVEEERVRAVEAVGGRYVRLPTGKDGRFAWADVLSALAGLGVRSVMVEGGGDVINSLLVPPGSGFVDAVVITIAPVWLGQGGVVASPPRVAPEPGGGSGGGAGGGGDDEEKGHGSGADSHNNSSPAPLPQRLSDVSWFPMGEDVVMCGRIPK